jgi:hypothetical protein
VGVVGFTRQPAEDTEESSEDIDTEDGKDQLERRPCFTATCDEDEPIFSEGNFQEQDFLHRPVVLHNTTAFEEQCAADDPGGNCEEYTQDDGNDPDFGKLPFDGTFFGVGVLQGELVVFIRVGSHVPIGEASRVDTYIVSNGHSRKISEKSDEDNKLGADGLVDDDHGSDQVDLEMQTQSDTVLDVRLHTLENLSGNLDSEDDSAETGGEEDNVGGGLSSFRRALDSNTTIGLLEGGSVVDTYESVS